MAEKIRLDSRYNDDGEYEPSESEEEYSQRDKKLLERYRRKQTSDSEGEQEVYGFSESESEKDDVADSDVEGQEGSEDDLPDARAWGQKKRSFYNTDYVDQDFGGFGKDEEAATLEEQEAKALQKRLTEQLGEDDFSFELFSTKKIDDKSEAEILIKSDLSQMSKRQKLQLLQKESPEFMGLVEDFKEKITIAKDVLRPALTLFKQKSVPASIPSIHFIKTYYETILNYCTDISFYILLKTKKVSIHNHPVTKRLFQFRQILKQMEPLFLDSLKPQLVDILQASKNGLDLEVTVDGTKSSKRKLDKVSNGGGSKKLKMLQGLGKNASMDNGDGPGERNESSDDYNDVNEDIALDARPEAVSNGVADSEFVVDGEKRAITYQMAKNKGLTPRRKKEQRNPRVKHRNKYRKAKIRRKGAVREVRTEMSRYGGEISGIKANVKKSIKIR